MDQYNIGDISQIYVHYVNVLMDENARVVFSLSYYT